MPFSPKQQYASQPVLLTGALGFLGSVVLERLLRLTEVPCVYLIVRSKRTTPAAKRVEQLLCSPLFASLHDEAVAGRRNVFSRVQVVEGDLCLPGLGLEAADLAVLRSSVGIILHSAANIDLDADVQATLRANYLGTAALLEAAASFAALRGFVHVSTFFVNNHLPRNSLVKEQIYPLPLELNGAPVSHREYASAMLGMDAASANSATLAIMQRLGFTSTYAFGKSLTEQLVDEAAIAPGVARAIVRPSLIAGVAEAPYPGFINSYAGAGGYTMGYALGLFQGLGSVAYGSDMLLDLIPCDTVAALVVAAGGAAAATFGSAAAAKGAVVFHAASAESHPLSIVKAFEIMRRFWRANPAPLRLPMTSHVLIDRPHTPTAAKVAAGARRAQLKIRLVSGLLRLAGKDREARALQMGFKAFQVQNSLAYGKSIVCSVANARALQAQIPAKERPLWHLVFTEEVQSWDDYCATFQAGVRRLLFRQGGEPRKVQHSFAYRPSACADVLAGADFAASRASAAPVLSPVASAGSPLPSPLAAHMRGVEAPLVEAQVVAAAVCSKVAACEAAEQLERDLAGSLAAA